MNQILQNIHSSNLEELKNDMNNGAIFIIFSNKTGPGLVFIEIFTYSEALRISLLNYN